MVIFLVFEGATTGQVTFPARRQGGILHDERTFQIVDGMAELSGPTVYADALELLTIPGYRQATPDEQAKWIKKQRKAASISEARGG